jgi:hypothetical protein
VSDCCLTPNEQFFSCITERTNFIWWDDDDYVPLKLSNKKRIKKNREKKYIQVNMTYWYKIELVPKDFQIIWLSNIFVFSVPLKVFGSKETKGLKPNCQKSAMVTYVWVRRTLVLIIITWFKNCTLKKNIWYLRLYYARYVTSRIYIVEYYINPWLLVQIIYSISYGMPYDIIWRS